MTPTGEKRLGFGPTRSCCFVHPSLTNNFGRDCDHFQLPTQRSFCRLPAPQQLPPLSLASLFLFWFWTSGVEAGAFGFTQHVLLTGLPRPLPPILIVQVTRHPRPCHPRDGLLTGAIDRGQAGSRGDSEAPDEHKQRRTCRLIRVTRTQSLPFKIPAHDFLRS